MVGSCEKSFQELKDRLILTPNLTLPEGLNGFVVYCDASWIGLSYIMMFMRYSLRMLQVC